jgi:hypothetical protein
VDGAAGVEGDAGVAGAFCAQAENTDAIITIARIIASILLFFISLPPNFII